MLVNIPDCGIAKIIADNAIEMLIKKKLGIDVDVQVNGITLDTHGDDVKLHVDVDLCMYDTALLDVIFKKKS